MSSKNDLTLLGGVLRNYGGLLKDLCVKLDKDPAKWEPALGHLLREENPWEKPKFSILEPLAIVAEFSGVDNLNIDEHLRVTPQDERETAELIIGYLNPSIQDNFLGKIEKNVAKSKLRVYELRKTSVDNPIIANLGGESMAETTIAEMTELMRKQGRGQEEGILLVNNHSNIFYVRDAKGVLWAVSCEWSSGDGSWVVRAYSISAPLGWLAGRRVLARG